MQMFAFCNAVFIVFLCSTFEKMYWLCYHVVISYHVSHRLKLDELHVAREPRNEYL